MITVWQREASEEGLLTRTTITIPALKISELWEMIPEVETTELKQLLLPRPLNALDSWRFQIALTLGTAEYLL